MTHIATKTRAALLTPAAPGAIAVIVLCGEGVREILDVIARRPLSDAPPAWQDRRPTLCRIFDGDNQIDDAVVTQMSHGGTAQAEIHLHGGVRIAQRVLMLLERLGAAVVPAAEFPDLLRSDDRVVRRIDCAIQTAGSRRLVRWLLTQRDVLPAFMGKLDALSAMECEEFERRSRAARRLLAGIRVAIVGPPNAGKSTLANRLIGSERVITSDIPGTTRDWVSETALVDGWPVILIDTAGIRDTDCDIEAEAVRRGGEQARLADLILLVTDATESVDVQQSAMRLVCGGLPTEIPVIHVVNKCDRLDDGHVAGVESVMKCSISALTGRGIVELERAICGVLGLDGLDDGRPAAFFEIQDKGNAS
ncbi:MAG: 50S ribosome-binding GTPase [Planctomycetes bacterium]|nr:50S ribosome-binding GTPase [Planctomycetota bacterium]